jgi:hypothetical protein
MRIQLESANRAFPINGGVLKSFRRMVEALGKPPEKTASEWEKRLRLNIG